MTFITRGDPVRQFWSQSNRFVFGAEACPDTKATVISAFIHSLVIVIGVCKIAILPTPSRGVARKVGGGGRRFMHFL